MTLVETAPEVGESIERVERPQRLRRCGVFVAKVLFAATAIGTAVGAGVYVAGQRLKDDAAESIVRKGTPEIQASLGQEIAPAVDEVAGRMEVGINEKLDGVASDMQDEIRAEIASEVE